MGNLEDQLISISQVPISILDNTIPIHKYTAIDLSVANDELLKIDIPDPYTCKNYIDDILRDNNAQVAYGGYLEKRNLYQNNSNFLEKGETPRNIHLGIDFWTKAGTKVVTPIKGKVHSFANNNFSGDYGPTIILSHSLAGISFHTLYGHLSLESLENLYIGKEYDQGEELATLGTPDINVNYAPHLHFQIIRDMGKCEGDFPGVSTLKELEYHTKNCPDPQFLLKI